jgi:hypothetical protein
MRTVDDRDQPIELHALDRALMKRPMYMPMKLTEAQRRRNERMSRDGMILTVLPFILVVLGGYFTINTLNTFPCLGTIALLIVMWLAIAWSVRRYERVDAIHWVTAYKRCGACGHSLRGLNEEHDGCIVCPECGAAWRIPAFEYSPPGGDSFGL